MGNPKEEKFWLSHPCVEEHSLCRIRLSDYDGAAITILRLIRFKDGSTVLGRGVALRKGDFQTPTEQKILKRLIRWLLRWVVPPPEDAPQ